MDGRLSIRDARELGIEWVRPTPPDKHAHQFPPMLICINVGAAPTNPVDNDHITYFGADYPAGIKIPIGGPLTMFSVTVARSAALFEPYREMLPGTEEWNKAVLEAQRKAQMRAGPQRIEKPTGQTALGKDHVPAR